MGARLHPTPLPPARLPQLGTPALGQQPQPLDCLPGQADTLWTWASAVPSMGLLEPLWLGSPCPTRTSLGLWELPAGPDAGWACGGGGAGQAGLGLHKSSLCEARMRGWVSWA